MQENTVVLDFQVPSNHWIVPLSGHEYSNQLWSSSHKGKHALAATAQHVASLSAILILSPNADSVVNSH